jgi:predicted nuclease with TOPRIM domain
MFTPGEQDLENLKAAVIELKAALTWERTQKVRLLEELGRYHGEIKRLQDRLTDLELQLAESKQASAPKGSAMAERVEDGAPH